MGFLLYEIEEKAKLIDGDRDQSSKPLSSWGE